MPEEPAEEMRTAPVEERRRLTAKEAAIAAKNYYRDLSGKTDADVEEIELCEDKSAWLVTLGTIRTIYGIGKDYRQFVVDAYTGEVISMKVKKI